MDALHQFGKSFGVVAGGQVAHGAQQIFTDHGLSPFFLQRAGWGRQQEDGRGRPKAACDPGSCGRARKRRKLLCVRGTEGIRFRSWTATPEATRRACCGFLRIMTDLPKVGMLGAGACESRRDHGRREGGRVTVHMSAPLVGGVLDESLPADVRADARHDGRSCRCVPVRDVRGPCRRLVACRPDAAGKDKR